MYQQEEKECRQQLSIECSDGIHYVWAYTLEEAIQICLDKGLIVPI